MQQGRKKKETKKEKEKRTRVMEGKREQRSNPSSPCTHIESSVADSSIDRLSSPPNRRLKTGLLSYRCADWEGWQKDMRAPEEIDYHRQLQAQASMWENFSSSSCVSSGQLRRLLLAPTAIGREIASSIKCLWPAGSDSPSPKFL